MEWFVSLSQELETNVPILAKNVGIFFITNYETLNNLQFVIFSLLKLKLFNTQIGTRNFSY